MSLSVVAGQESLPFQCLGNLKKLIDATFVFSPHLWENQKKNLGTQSVIFVEFKCLCLF